MPSYGCIRGLNGKFNDGGQGCHGKELSFTVSKAEIKVDVARSLGGGKRKKWLFFLLTLVTGSLISSSTFSSIYWYVLANGIIHHVA